MPSITGCCIFKMRAARAFLAGVDPACAGDEDDAEGGAVDDVADDVDGAGDAALWAWLLDTASPEAMQTKAIETKAVVGFLYIHSF